MTRSQVQPDTGSLAPFVPRALLARLARPIDVLAETVECTTVFADVSGFSRLSERLARRGEEGAVQLVDLINACFTPLLAEAYGRGGSLVKFGGDAMVLLFYDQRGDQQHAVRACCAAAADGGGEEAEEQTAFEVVLQAAGDKKIQVIKVVRAATGLGPKEAKALVDEAPKPIKEGIDRAEADKLKADLEEAGATVDLK